MKRFPPTRRLRAGLRLALITLIALLAFPTFSPSQSNGNNEKDLVNALQEIIGDFQLEVRDIEGNLKEAASSFPKVISDSQFSSTIFDLGTTIYDAQIQHGVARREAIEDVIQDIQTFGIDTTNPNALRGSGGCTDREIEEWLWEEPSEFGKDLEKFGRKTKFSVEHFDSGSEKFITQRVPLSIQVFPEIKDKLIFTGGIYTSMMMYQTTDVRINGIVGGSYGDPNTGNTLSCAGVFGWAPPNTMVNVVAAGLNGPFMGSDMSDSNGNWRVQLEGLSHGYYEFMADDTNTQDFKEQAFIQVELKFSF